MLGPGGLPLEKIQLKLRLEPLVFGISVQIHSVGRLQMFVRREIPSVVANPEIVGVTGWFLVKSLGPFKRKQDAARRHCLVFHSRGMIVKSVSPH